MIDFVESVTLKAPHQKLSILFLYYKDKKTLVFTLQCKFLWCYSKGDLKEE